MDKENSQGVGPQVGIRQTSQDGGHDNPVFEPDLSNLHSTSDLNLSASTNSEENNADPEVSASAPSPPDYNKIFPNSHPESIAPIQEENQSKNQNETKTEQVIKNPDSKPVTIWTPPENNASTSDEGEGRDVWDSPLEFLLSCISMSVGLGNVWRFPFAAYSNGGGAFLIPYLIVLLLIGRPIYYLEMCLGQFSSSGPVKVWNMAPMFKGVGYGSLLGAICVVSYYCSIMATTVFYFFASFAKDLPWSVCNKDWGGDLCNENGTTNTNLTDKSISALYYELEVFPRYDHINDGLGSPEWRLTLCLLLSWIVIFLTLWKGVQSSGKVAYFTAIFPYVVLLILLIRGVTLEGAWEGIKYFIKPQWSEIYKPKVWYAAVGQCFFSLGTGFGPIIMFSSYNPFRHNVYRDALIISLMDTFTSLLAGCTIFSVLGNLSVKSGVPIESVTDGGSGLAFVSYPEAIAQFDWVPQLFAVLFFLMLFTLGIGTAASLTGGVVTIICDQFPKWMRWLVTLVVCSVGMLLSLMYVTPGGPFMLDLIDHFGANFVIYVMAMFEVAAVSWCYGLNNFCRDIEFMLRIKVGYYWRFCWGYFIPLALFGILVYALWTEGEFTSGDVPYPKIATGFILIVDISVSGWLLAAFSVILVPGWALHAIWTRKATTFRGKFMEALRPTKQWGPKSGRNRAEWEQFKKWL